MIATCLINNSCLLEVHRVRRSLPSHEWNHDNDADLQQARANTSKRTNKNKQKKKKKSVRFDETRNRSYPSKWSPQQRKQLWLNRHTCRRFERQATNDAVYWMLFDDQQHDNKNSYQKVLEDLHQACGIVTSETDPQLADYTRQRRQCLTEIPDDRLGLEYNSLIVLNGGRRERQTRIRKRVAQIQATIPPHRVEERAQALRETCEATSLPGRLMAVQLALLAAAVPPY